MSLSLASNVKKSALTLLTILSSQILMGGNDDFATSFTEENTNYTQQIVTADGWSLSNCGIKDIGGIFAPTLTGNTASPGKITSPLIESGISSLSFNYMCYYSDKIVNLTVNIIQSDNVVRTYQLYNDAVTQKEIYRFAEEDIDLDGGLVIEIINNSPSGAERYNIDRVSIWNISWTDYAGSEHAMTPECSVMYRDYEYGETLEFDNPAGVDILYCFKGMPDHRNIFAGPSWLSEDYPAEEPEYTEGITYSHTTHPLVYLGHPIEASYVSYAEGKLPSEVKTINIISTGIKPEVSGEESPEYFDLCGRHVANPVSGIFIERRGDRYNKIIR